MLVVPGGSGPGGGGLDGGPKFSVFVFFSRLFFPTFFRCCQCFSLTCVGGLGVLLAFQKRCKTHIWSPREARMCHFCIVSGKQNTQTTNTSQRKTLTTSKNGGKKVGEGKKARNFGWSGGRRSRRVVSRGKVRRGSGTGVRCAGCSW